MNVIKLNSIKSAVKNIQTKKVGFDVNPLDIGLAEIQMNLIKRLEREIPEHGAFATVVEKFESKNPMMDISTIEVACKFLDKDVPKKTQTDSKKESRNKKHEVGHMDSTSQSEKKIPVSEPRSFVEGDGKRSVTDGTIIRCV